MKDSKKYNIYLKYTDGSEETTTINTHDIQWSIEQFLRNRKPISNVNIELDSDEKEK